MKFEELLKAQGLNEEQIQAIKVAMTTEKIYTTNEENIADRYSKLKIKKEALQEELGEANTTIADLKKSNKGNEELQKKVTEYEGTIETLKKDNDVKNFEMALELELTKSNAKKTRAVKALLDLNKVKQKEDGTFDGLDEQLVELKKSDDYLFNTGEVKQTYSPVGGGSVSTGDLATLMKSKEFNLTEYLEKQNKK